jgi:uncharacterized protein (DUF2141 family)
MTLIMAFASLLIGGCSGSDSTGRLTIMLTDAPAAADIRAAVVTIDQIYLQGEATDDRVVLRDQPFTTDLLTLSSDVAMLVESATVPAGSYEQLRFVVSGGYISVAEGDSTPIYATPGYANVPGPIAGELRTPSWDTSGFKVTLPEGKLDIEGEQRVLIVDFDVGESFGRQLGNGAWMMRPVLHAFDFLASGSISVNADVRAVALAGPLTVELDDARGNLVAIRQLADTDGDRQIPMQFRFLDPRESPYRLTLPDVITSPSTPIEIVLSSGQTVSIDLTVVAFAPPSDAASQAP